MPAAALTAPVQGSRFPLPFVTHALSKKPAQWAHYPYMLTSGRGLHETSGSNRTDRSVDRSAPVYDETVRIYTQRQGLASNLTEREQNTSSSLLSQIAGDVRQQQPGPSMCIQGTVCTELLVKKCIIKAAAAATLNVNYLMEQLGIC